MPKMTETGTGDQLTEIDELAHDELTDTNASEEVTDADENEAESAQVEALAYEQLTFKNII